MSIRVPPAVSRASPQGVAASAGPRDLAKKAPGPLDSFQRAMSRSIPSGPPTLQRGSVGGQVTALQQKLYARGLMTAADIGTGRGVFGPRTEAAVRRLQASVGLPVSGVVGPSTYAALTKPPPIQEVPTDRFTTGSHDPRMADTLTDDFTEPAATAHRAAGV